jgi:hypothetical protein
LRNLWLLKCAAFDAKHASRKKVAISHTARVFMDIMQEIYSGRSISRFGDIFGLQDLRTSSALGTEDKNSGRGCRYFTGRASGGSFITCLLG